VAETGPSQLGAREAEIRASTADTLDQLTLVVEAGLGFDAALARVARTNTGPLAVELQHTVEDVRAGMPQDQALRGLAQRTRLPEIEQLVSALIQAQRHGVTIAETLRIQSTDLRERRMAGVEEQAAKLATKLIFPVMVCFMPVFIAVLVVPSAVEVAQNVFRALVLVRDVAHYSLMVDPTPVLRTATLDDADAITTVMRASVLELFPRYYDERQTASASIYVAHVDTTLLADGTYFVHECDGEIVACGGWSRRGRLYTGAGEDDDDERLLDPDREAAHIRAMFVRPDWTRRGLGTAILRAGHDAARSEGFGRLDLGATLPGVALYRAFGFRDVAPLSVTMPDGVTLEGVEMERPIDLLSAAVGSPS
jgi:GNAT superfamily N-acetyltransferase